MLLNSKDMPKYQTIIERKSIELNEKYPGGVGAQKGRKNIRYYCNCLDMDSDNLDNN